MKILTHFFGLSRQQINLGRWSLKYDEKILNRIVYFANEDHCGCCEVKKNNEDEYYLPFVFNL